MSIFGTLNDMACWVYTYQVLSPGQLCSQSNPVLSFIQILCHHLLKFCVIIVLTFCVIWQDSVVMVKELFRDKELTEFIIATIPTVLGINESRRLLQALCKEQIPCRRIIINQVALPMHSCSLTCFGMLILCLSA